MSEFESIAILPGDDQNDEVWCVVRRYIDGAWHRFIERFKPREFADTLYDAHFVDCAGSGKAWYNPATAGSTTIGDYTEYFIAYQPEGVGTKYICNAKTDDTIDTTWGSSGYWNGPSEGGICYDIHQLDDGRLLASHTYYKVTMINADGTTDATWATNGTYTMPTNGVEVYKILEDNDGNFHLFGGASVSGYTYVKLDANGTYVTGINGQFSRLWIFYDAVWSDESKTRIIAVGGNWPISTGVGFVYANMMAIDPATGAKDTTWDGNLSYAGFAEIPFVGGGGGQTNLHVVTLSDGGFVMYRNNANTLVKSLADGSNVDTTWGTNGLLAVGTAAINPTQNKIAQDGDVLYVLADNAGPVNTISVVDASGTVTDSVDISAAAGTYHCIQLVNDNLIIGATGAPSSTNEIEIWDKDTLTYQSGFDITAAYVFFVLPDEDTRETTIVPGQSESWGTTPTGYAHLEGETVNILADGVKYPQQAVASAAIDETEFSSATYKTVGLPVEYRLQPMKVNLSTRGFIPLKNIRELILSVYQSLDGRFGRNFTGQDRIPYGYLTYNASPQLTSGRIAVPFEGTYDNAGDVAVWDDGPLPMTVRSIGLKMGAESE